MIVVDTNVIAQLLIRGEKTGAAQALYRKDRLWLVPLLWRHEFLNVISSFVRYGGANPVLGAKTWEQALAMFGSNETEVDLKRALELSIAGDISAHDAQFVALAAETGVPLVTEDRRLTERFPQIAVSISEFLGE